MAGLNEAVHAAIHGPERQDIDIRGHGFNVKPITRQDVNGVLHAWGQISHKLKFRPDDQVFFHLQKKDGMMQIVDRELNRGGWQKLAGPASSVIAAYFGVPLAPEAVSGVMNSIADINPSGWEQACDMIIASVALHL